MLVDLTWGFSGFPMASVCVQVKLVTVSGNKEQLISFRVYEKSATNAQTDRDG